MSNLDSPKIETRFAVEQRPFKSLIVQEAFGYWFEITDSVKPQFVSRDDWNLLDTKLNTNEDGTKTVYIPDDLQLWEMVEVMKSVDQDTYKDQPEKQGRHSEAVAKLGEMFKLSGIYIAKRLDAINEGKVMAQALAEDMFRYGTALLNPEAPDNGYTIDAIKAYKITDEQTKRIDRYLAGEAAYQNRLKKVIKARNSNDYSYSDPLEEQRKRTLAQFFKVAAKAFQLEKRFPPTPDQVVPATHSKFLNKVEESLKREIEKPKQELLMTALDRGMQRLVEELRVSKNHTGVYELFAEEGIDLEDRRKRLIDALEINTLKKELREIRDTGNVERISTKEREVADAIQDAVMLFDYHEGVDSPMAILHNESLNCVGASLLGSALMEEVGLNYLVGSIPQHSILFLVTENGQVEWRDMRDKQKNMVLSDEMLKGQKGDGSPLTTTDIVDFSRNPQPKGLAFEVNTDLYRENYKWIKKNQKQFVTISNPKEGIYLQVLNNAAITLFEQGYYQHSAILSEQALAVQGNSPDIYNTYAASLYNLGRQADALDSYKKAYELNPDDIATLNGLGDVYTDLNRYQEAIEMYQRFITLARGEVDESWIKRAQERISQLQSQ